MMIFACSLTDEEFFFLQRFLHRDEETKKEKVHHHHQQTTTYRVLESKTRTKKYYITYNITFLQQHVTFFSSILHDARENSPMNEEDL